MIKLERTNDPQIQEALSKLEKRESRAQEEVTSTPRSGRKGSKNYREESSDDDEEWEEGSKGKKGKIFKTKESPKDKRKSKNFLILIFGPQKIRIFKKIQKFFTFRKKNKNLNFGGERPRDR